MGSASEGDSTVTLLSAHFPHTREVSFSLSMCAVEGAPFRWPLTDGTEAAKSLAKSEAHFQTSLVNAEHPAGRPRDGGEGKNTCHISPMTELNPQNPWWKDSTKNCPLTSAQVPWSITITTTIIITLSLERKENPARNKRGSSLTSQEGGGGGVIQYITTQGPQNFYFPNGYQQRAYDNIRSEAFQQKSH